MSYYNIIFIFSIVKNYCEEIGFIFTEIIRNVYDISYNNNFITRITNPQFETTIGDHRDTLEKLYKANKQFDIGQLIKKMTMEHDLTL